MSAREAILAKLKSQVAGAGNEQLPAEPRYPLSQLNVTEQFEQFVALLHLNQAKVIETRIEALPEVVASEMNRLGMTSLLYPKGTPFSEQIESVGQNINVRAFDFELDAEGKSILFDQVEAGITTSNSAIAALGAIVLWPTTNEPRTLSLVPEAHFVIVERQNLYPDFPTLIKQQNWYDKMPTNALLISGPSKTGDIQQTMAFGAHGPKHMIVLVV